jgi:2-amino-4-hydroxy-6-hydroxymethyldihydropteridine diphosphokinase
MTPSWVPAYVGVGSNLDDPVLQVTAALTQLAQLPECKLVMRSPLYRSAPLGPQDQPHFINAVAGVLTTLDPLALLRALKALELALGRSAPIVRWGARRIDFDLLVHGGARLSDPELTLPHPGVPTRNFVLYPLCAIAADLWVPGLDTVRELTARVSAVGLQRLELG